MTRRGSGMSRLAGALRERYVSGRRARVLARRIAGLLPTGAKVLDVGCGDGTIDALILGIRPDLTIRGIDVLVRPDAKIPVDWFDGVRLPCGDKTIDVVTFIDVLHHTDDPEALLTEAKRVARKAIVLKDHTLTGLGAYSTLRFMDWTGNAHHGIALPYNYWTEQRWREAFHRLRLHVADWRSDLELYPYPASLVFGRQLHFVASVVSQSEEAEARTGITR